MAIILPRERGNIFVVSIKGYSLPIKKADCIVVKMVLISTIVKIDVTTSSDISPKTSPKTTG